MGRTRVRLIPDTGLSVANSTFHGNAEHPPQRSGGVVVGTGASQADKAPSPPFAIILDNAAGVQSRQFGPSLQQTCDAFLAVGLAPGFDRGVVLKPLTVFAQQVFKGDLTFLQAGLALRPLPRILLEVGELQFGDAQHLRPVASWKKDTKGV